MSKNLKSWTLGWRTDTVLEWLRLWLSLDLNGPSVTVERLRIFSQIWASECLRPNDFLFANSADRGHKDNEGECHKVNGSPDKVAPIPPSHRYNASLRSTESLSELLGTAFEGWIGSTVLVGGIRVLLTKASILKELVQCLTCSLVVTLNLAEV